MRVLNGGFVSNAAYSLEDFSFGKIPNQNSSQISLVAGSFEDGRLV